MCIRDRPRRARDETGGARGEAAMSERVARLERELESQRAELAQFKRFVSARRARARASLSSRAIPPLTTPGRAQDLGFDLSRPPPRGGALASDSDVAAAWPRYPHIPVPPLPPCIGGGFRAIERPARGAGLGGVAEI